MRKLLFLPLLGFGVLVLVMVQALTSSTSSMTLLTAISVGSNPGIAQTYCQMAAMQITPGNTSNLGVQAFQAIQQVFPRDQWLIALSVARQESSWNPTIVNSIGASGLFQILRSAHPEFAAQWANGSWADPRVNAWMAYVVWVAAGYSWTPWEAYTTGAYLRWEADAQNVIAGEPIASPDVPTCLTAGSAGTVEAGALALAQTQLGVPYVFGGATPAGFDCSGLVMWAFARVGVTLPHSSEMQWQMLPHVAPTAATAGDLVFANPGEFQAGLPGHVGFYLGNGMMLDAPHTGAVVRVESLQGWNVVGFARAG